MKTPDPTDPFFRWSRDAGDPPWPDNPPPGFVTQVLARVAAEEPAERDWLLWLLPRAVAVAAVLAVTASLPSIFAPRPPAETELAHLLFQSALPSSP